MKNEILQKLEQIALNRTTRFCFSCHVKAPEGVCPVCHSDDLGHTMDGVGADWSIEFAIDYILQEELTPVDLDKAFEETIRSCYPDEFTVGWMTLDTVSVMKDQDPISWGCAQSDWESQEEEEGNIISFNNGSTYYWTHDLEELVDRE